MRLKFFIAPVTFFLALGFSSCASEVETTSSPVVIGGVFGLTGGDQDLDIPTMRGAQLAVKEINAAGGVLGHPVTLGAEDCKSDSADAAAVVSRIASANSGKVIGYVGLSDSDPALGAGKSATALGLPFITAGATYPKLPDLAGRSMFLACFGDNVQAAAGAEFAHDSLNKRSAFILFNHDYTYTLKLSDYFRTRWNELGGSIAAEASYAANDKNFATAIAAIKSAKPDLIYASAMPDDVAALARQLRAAQITATIIGGDGWDIPSLPTDLGPSGDSLYYTTHAFLADTAAGMTKFSTAYKAAYGVAPENSFAALGYDAVMLLADAVKRAGSLHSGSATITALEATQNFAGVTGSISFSPTSHVPKKTVSIIGLRSNSAYLRTAFVPRSVPAP